MSDMPENGTGWNWLRTLLVLIAMAAVGTGMVILGSWWLRPRITDDVVARLKDPATRLGETRRLGETGWPEAVPYLAWVAKTEDPAHRRAALEALASIGGPEAVDALEAAAEDPDAGVRLAAARGLGALGARLCPEGLGALLHDAGPAVRAAAVRALPDDSADPDLAEALADAARDADSAVRAAAVEEAAMQRASAAYGALLAALGDTETSIASSAKAQVQARQGDLAPLALRHCSAIESEDDRLDLGRMMALVATADQAPALLNLLEGGRQRRRDDPPERLREMVVSTLAAMGPEAAPVLVEETVYEERGQAAEAAARAAIARIGPAAGPAVAEGLLAWRIYPDPEELKAWVTVLGAVGDASADTAEALSRALSQGAPGMDEAVGEARRAIESRTGRAPPTPAPEPDLPGGEPGPEAWTRIGGRPVDVARPGTRIETLPDDGVVHIELDGGITWSDRPDHSGAFPLLLVFSRRGGEWEEDFHAFAVKFNKRNHRGRVIGWEAGDPAKLRVEILLGSDLWRHAAYAEYTIELRSSDKGLTARFTGTCNDEPREGPATVTGWPTSWDTGDVPPLAPDEHPRLLFRTHHVAQLRARTRTPVGREIFRALMARMASGKRLYRTKLDWVNNWEAGADQATGHGFLARVFDDRRHGERAVELIMPRTLQRPYQGEHGERLPGPMARYPFAADLIFAEYTEHERRQVLASAGHMRLAFSCEWGPVGVYAVSRSILGVPGANALMLLGEEGRLGLQRPPAPPPAVVTLEAETPPGDATPRTVPFEAGGLVAEWLWAGGVEPGEEDVLADLGGREGAWIEAGDTFAFGGADYTFRHLSEKAFRGLAGITKERYLFPPGDPRRRRLLYTTLEVGEPTCVRIPGGQHFGHPQSTVFLHGRRIESGTVVILEPGVHRLLLEVVGTVVNPRFPAIRAGYATALWKKHAWLVREYEAAKARWKATGQVQDMPFIFDVASKGGRASLMAGGAVKRGGRRGGDILWPLVSARWIATGRGLYPDTPWGPASDPEKWSAGQMGARELCFMMGPAPEPLRAEMAREFRRRYLEGDEIRRLGCLELVAALVNYPMELEKP